MRFLIEAVKDINKSIGDRQFNNKKGDTLELSSAGVELALSNMLDGSYKFVEEIPESDAEKERAKNAEKQERMQADLSQAAEKVAARQDAEKSALAKLPKATLVKKAVGLKIGEADTLNKQPLVEAIMESKFGGAGGPPAFSPTGAQSSQDAVDAAATNTATTVNTTAGKQTVSQSGNVTGAAGQTSNISGHAPATTGGGKGVI